MFKIFYPDEDAASAYDIPYEDLYKRGIRGVVFDIDNTLVPHDAPADERVRGEKSRDLQHPCKTNSSKRRNSNRIKKTFGSGSAVFLPQG